MLCNAWPGFPRKPTRGFFHVSFKALNIIMQNVSVAEKISRNYPFSYTGRRAEPPPTINTALEHYQAGQVPQAVAIVQQMLQAEPSHPDALHFLGVISLQGGNTAGAVELIGKAIRAKPNSLMHYNLGLALRVQGKLDEAAASYRKAIALQPGYLGGCAQQPGQRASGTRQHGLGNCQLPQGDYA
jgi:tetratricopeptide (TPR) repeat protein